MYSVLLALIEYSPSLLEDWNLQAIFLFLFCDCRENTIRYLCLFEAQTASLHARPADPPLSPLGRPLYHSYHSRHQLIIVVLVGLSIRAELTTIVRTSNSGDRVASV